MACLALLRSLWYLRYWICGVNISPRASISISARLKGNVKIGHGSSIGKGVSIVGNVSIGQNSRIEKEVEIAGNIKIGDSTLIGSYSILTTMPDGQVEIGNDVLVNSFSVLGASQRLRIEDHCIFAAFVQITDAMHGIDDVSVLIKHAETRSAPVTIEQNVWLGSAAMVMMGVTVGEGSVIGAKSLVTRNIPPNSVAFGIPAKVMRTRKEKESLSK